MKMLSKQHRKRHIMRERKLRAWDKTNKRMYYVGFDDLLMSVGSQSAGDYSLVDQVGEEIAGFAGGRHDQHRDDMEYMDWTGMADKNKRDIYEGDILGLDDTEDTSKAVVVFHDAAFKAQLVISGIIVYSTDWDGWVVIGNKFEHPHLLEQSEGKQ
jgi:uncharacterized phage protein (TIGR01671 family)